MHRRSSAKALFLLAHADLPMAAWAPTGIVAGFPLALPGAVLLTRMV